MSSCVKHKNNRLCDKCCIYIKRFFENHLITFWTRINDFIEYKTLSLGDISKNVPLNMFDTSYISSSNQSEEQSASSSDEKTILEKAKQVKMLDISIIKAPYYGDQDVNDKSFRNLFKIYFTIENIYYIDFELISKMFKALNYVFNANESKMIANIRCSDALPRLLFDDLVIYSQESYVMKKQSRPICIQLKCTLYNEQSASDVDFYSPIQRKLNAILSQSNDLFGERLTHKTIVNIHKSDINHLKKHLDMMFSDLCGDEIIRYDIHLIRCRNQKLIDPKSSNYIIPGRMHTIVNVCDAVFCVKGYFTTHLLSLLSKYTELIMTDSFKSNGNTTYSSWKLMYFGIEKNIQPKDLDDSDDVIVGFSLQSADKDDFDTLSSEPSSSSSSAASMRSSKRTRSSEGISTKKSRS